MDVLLLFHQIYYLIDQMKYVMEDQKIVYEDVQILIIYRKKIHRHRKKNRSSS